MIKPIQLLVACLWTLCFSMLNSYDAMAQVGGEAELRYKRIQEHKICREGCTESYRKSAPSVDGSTVMNATQACLQNCDRLIDGSQSIERNDRNGGGYYRSTSSTSAAGKIAAFVILLAAILFFLKKIKPELFSKMFSALIVNKNHEGATPANQSTSLQINERSIKNHGPIILFVSLVLIYIISDESISGAFIALPTLVIVGAVSSIGFHAFFRQRRSKPQLPRWLIESIIGFLINATSLLCALLLVFSWGTIIRAQELSTISALATGLLVFPLSIVQLKCHLKHIGEMSPINLYIGGSITFLIMLFGFVSEAKYLSFIEGIAMAGAIKMFESKYFDRMSLLLNSISKYDDLVCFLLKRLKYKSQM